MNPPSQKKLKILVSAYACNPSASLQLHPGEDLTGWKLVEQLSRSHEVWVLTHTYNRPAIESLIRKHSEGNPRFLFVELPRLLRGLYAFGIGERLYYYFWQIAAWLVARRIHGQIRFDLAHHLTFGNYWMPSFIGAFLKIPFVWGPVGGGQKTPASLFGRYSLFGQFSEIGRDFAQWIGRNLLLSRKRCLENASAILVCNRETKAQFAKKYWPRISYFPVNGISKQDLSGRTGYRPSKTFRIISAGRMIRLKGFDLCIEAFARFREKFPDSSMEIVGQGPEERRLRELAEKKRCSDSIEFVPWLDRRSLLKRMCDCDVFLFASFRDGGGAVVIEAMASGLPVVCLDSGGPGFHVQNSWGIRISSRRAHKVIEDMTNALTDLRRKPAWRRKLGEAGKKRAGEYYLWENLGLRLNIMYSDVLKAEASASQVG